MGENEKKRSNRSPRLGKSLRFMQRLWALAHALDSKSKRMHKELGVTGAQRLVLRIVGRYPGIIAGDVAALLHVHPSTLTGVLMRLEDRDLILRTPDPTDRRRTHFSLTRAGLDLDRELAGTVEAAVGRALARCDAATVEAGSRLIEILVEELTDERPTPTDDD